MYQNVRLHRDKLALVERCRAFAVWFALAPSRGRILKLDFRKNMFSCNTSSWAKSKGMPHGPAWHVQEWMDGGLVHVRLVTYMRAIFLLHICMYVYIYLCIHVYVYIYINVYEYACIYIYVCTYISSSRSSSFFPTLIMYV